MKLAVIHLVRAGEGLETFKRFIDSYCRNMPKEDHTLILLWKGFNTGSEQHVEYLQEMPYVSYEVSDYGNALYSLRVCIESIQTVFTHFIFLNSYSEILKPDWLTQLIRNPNGLTSCTCSHEAMGESKWWKKLFYRKFPNPHVRTNAFCISCELFLLHCPRNILTKTQAHLFESGRNSLTAQMLKGGYNVICVTTTGMYGPTNFLYTNCFRMYEQEQLLVADNQTRRYIEAGFTERNHLTKLAWGY